MAKYSDDAKEIGASRTPAIVLGQTKFSTNERERQKTLYARQGIPFIESDFNSEAKERGDRFEPVLINWSVDKLIKIGQGEADVRLHEVTDGHRLPDLGLCASLDAMIQIDGEISMQDPQTKGQMILTGMGALEIKTSNSDEFPRPDQVIQLQTQLLCSGLKWGIIAIFGKSQRLLLEPYKADQELHNIIMEKVTEFWQKVDLDEPYPPLDNGKPYTINLDHLKTKNEVINLAMDWAKADAEVRAWTMIRDECQVGLELVMDQNDAEIAEIGEYKILHPIVKREAQPEKVVPAKEASYYRRFKIQKKEK